MLKTLLVILKVCELTVKLVDKNDKNTYLYRNMNLDNSHYQQAILLASILGVDIQKIFTGEYELTDTQKSEFEKKSRLLKNHYPLDYLLGSVPFAGQHFIISDDVLIPRPETEQLVLDLQSRFLESKYREMTLFDLGCGSGVIGISLAKYFGEIYCMDISHNALQIAKQNATKNKTVQIIFQQSDLLESRLLDTDLSKNKQVVLIANLPYIPYSDKSKSREYGVEFEPELALYSGCDGLDLFRQLIKQLEILKYRDVLPVECIFELDPRNIFVAQKLLQPLYYFTEVQKDMNQLDRFLVAKQPNSK
jgi:release factor glutamine methyltransferase